MNDQRFRRPRWAIAIFAILAAGVVGVLAYNAGVAHGLAMGVASAANAAVEQGGRVAEAGGYHHPYGYYYGWHPWPFGFGFPLFPLFPLFGLFFFLFLFRFFLWGGPARRHWQGGGAGCGRADDVPRRFDDWHRRAHGRMNAEPPSSGPPAPNAPPASNV
jgi:hypothetical protein